MNKQLSAELCLLPLFWTYVVWFDGYIALQVLIAGTVSQLALLLNRSRSYLQGDKQRMRNDPPLIRCKKMGAFTLMANDPINVLGLLLKQFLIQNNHLFQPFHTMTSKGILLWLMNIHVPICLSSNICQKVMARRTSHMNTSSKLVIRVNN